MTQVARPAPPLPAPEPEPAERTPRAMRAGTRRTIAAFAEVMAPGGDGLPAAGNEIDVAGSVAALAPSMPPAQLRAIELAVTAFERRFGAQGFSARPRAERERLLDRLGRSRRALDRELLLLMKALTVSNYCADERVRAAVGERTDCDGREPAAESGRAALGTLEATADAEECDVAIVGSGAGGAAAALELAEAGLDVVVLEAGAHRDRSSYPANPLRATAELYRDGGLTVAAGLPPVPVPVGRVLGGTTVINSGTCFRAPDEVLRRWREEFGVAWATELEGRFEHAELLLDVQAPAEEQLGRNGRLIAEGARRIGASGAPLARNAGRCTQCSGCPQGCPRDAKRAMHVSLLPRAVTAGARIRTGIEAREVLVEGGRARGLRCVRTTGTGRRSYTLHARRAVLLAGGTLGTPELLLRSGLGGPQVGRNLRLHPSAWVGARFAEPVRGWEGVMQSYGVDQWASIGVMLEATFTPLAYGAHWLPGVGSEHARRIADFGRIGANGIQIRDERSRGRVALGRGGALRISYRLHREEARKLGFAIARAAEIFFAAGAEEVYPQVSGGPILRPADVAAFELSPPPARRLRIEAFHPMGTARMSERPGDGVIDTEGAVRGIRDLHVADASIFPTAPGVNPMLTIIACAGEIAARLARRLA